MSLIFKLRIAFLKPGGESAIDKTAVSLAVALQSAGHQITEYTYSSKNAPGSVESILSIIQAAEQVSKFDLIHSFGNPLAAAFAKLVPHPIIITLAETPPEYTALIKQYCAHANILLPAKLAEDSGIKCYANAPETAPDGSVTPETVIKYIEIYDKTMRRSGARRPWGEFENLAEGLDHKLKRITVDPGKRLSLQKHTRRKEHWVIISGIAEVQLGDKTSTLRPGDSVDIPEQTLHRIYNPGPDKLVFGETQLGNYFGEDDIIRIEDDYGRHD